MEHRRPGWDEYFLGIAEAVAARGECVRSRVGAVIVRDQRILATGYNGVAAGQPSCLDGLCPRAQNNAPKGTRYDDPQGKCIAFHAEDNAVADAMLRGIDIHGATVYLTKEPCERCDELLSRVGVTAVWRRDDVLHARVTVEHRAVTACPSCEQPVEVDSAHFDGLRWLCDAPAAGH